MKAQQKNTATVHLWVGRCDIEPSRVDELLSLLTQKEVLRAGRFHFMRDYTRYVYSHAMLRQVLGEYVGQAPQEVAIKEASGGKPYLQHERGVFFNLSHSDELFAIGVAHGHEIGIDIEKCKALKDMELIARRIMTRGEYGLFRGCDGRARLDFFYRCWVRKEAVVKAWGSGIESDFETISVADTCDQNHFEVLSDHRNGPPGIWTGKDLCVGEGFAGAVCVEGDGIQVRMMGADCC